MMTMRMNRTTVFALTLCLAGMSCVFAYPLDGYKDTGIRRVEGARLANEGKAVGGFQPPGAQLSTEQVDLRLLDHRKMTLPAPDPEFTTKVKATLGENLDRYAFAVLDLTNPDQPRLAEFRGDHRQNVGSVGKLLVALGYFQALADAWPDDLERRTAILRDTLITADDFSVSDHHTIRIFNVETLELVRRPMKVGDRGSVWEFLDWMLSVSSNSAASMVMRDAMLLRRYGRDYPVSDEEIRSFFADTPGPELTKWFQQTFWEPVTRNGLSLDQIRQGSFFTRQGKRNVAGGGNSYATAHTLMQFMLMMEQGKLVDEWSSRQIKRLLYMTERRIRFASSPALSDAAVYFKTGSLYKCQQEEGFECRPYMGNVYNYMNSVAIIEEAFNGVQLHYIAVVISHILRKNSAVDHQALATELHRLIKQQNTGVPATE